MTESQNNPEPASDLASNGPWRPSVAPGTYPSLEEIIGQAVGAGSVCWTSTPNGIFKSEEAKWIVDGAVESIRRTLDLDKRGSYPYISTLGNSILIGPECFADPEEKNIMWKGRHFRATPDQAETLTMIQTAAAKFMHIALGSLPKEAENVLIEHLTRAFNAGYQTAQDDLRAKEEAATDYERDQEVRRARGLAPVCGMAEQSAEDRRRQLERRQDQADLIDLILHYRNPASEETRMRQIRVVMD